MNGRDEKLSQDDALGLAKHRLPARRKTPRCSRCQRRIVGPRLVVGGLWMCNGCAYELERAADAGAGAPGDRVQGPVEEPES
jgi:ribosomal protein L37AE/L43A